MDYSSPSDVEGAQERVCSFLRAARATLVTEIDTTSSIAIISNSIQKLRLGGDLQIDDLESAGWLEDLEALVTFFADLQPALNTFFKRASNIKELEVVGFHLSQDVTDAILALKSLRFLDLRRCYVSPGPVRCASSSLASISLTIEDTRDVSGWRFISASPHLRFLALRYVADDPEAITLPPLSDHSGNPFSTIERLVAVHLPLQDINSLCEWMAAAKAGGRALPLTHFKLVTDTFGLTLPEIVPVLETLNGSPLRCLSLHGLHCAEVDFLTSIAEGFPLLESLSLQHRESPRQQRCKPARWPYASWEYAIAFSRFPRLKYFWWNWRLDGEVLATTALPLMEEGWPEEDLDDAHLFSPGWDTIARLFASHCPTLEMVAFLAGESPVVAHKIRRLASGAVLRIEEWMDGPYGKRGLMTDLQDMYDPVVFSGHGSFGEWLPNTPVII